IYTFGSNAVILIPDEKLHGGKFYLKGKLVVFMGIKEFSNVGIFHILATGHFTTSIHFKINDGVFTHSRDHTMHVDFNSSNETMSVLRQPLDVGFRTPANSISEVPSIVVRQSVPDSNNSDVKNLEQVPPHPSRYTRVFTPGPDNPIELTPAIGENFSSDFTNSSRGDSAVKEEFLLPSSETQQNQLSPMSLVTTPTRSPRHLEPTISSRNKTI
ncbi:hypothetical protein HK096_004441, partial [Nowakowskiella sp. JEL0078]